MELTPIIKKKRIDLNKIAKLILGLLFILMGAALLISKLI